MRAATDSGGRPARGRRRGGGSRPRFDRVRSDPCPDGGGSGVTAGPGRAQHFARGQEPAGRGRDEEAAARPGDRVGQPAGGGSRPGGNRRQQEQQSQFVGGPRRTIQVADGRLDGSVRQRCGRGVRVRIGGQPPSRGGAGRLRGGGPSPGGARMSRFPGRSGGTPTSLAQSAKGGVSPGSSSPA